MEGDFCCLSHVSHMDICSFWWCRGKVSSPEHSAYREHGKTIHMGDSCCPWDRSGCLGCLVLNHLALDCTKKLLVLITGKGFWWGKPIRKPCSSSSLFHVKTVPQASRRFLTRLVNVSWCPDKVHIVLAFIMSSIRCRPGTMCILHNCSAVLSFGEEGPHKWKNDTFFQKLHLTPPSPS